MTCQVVSIDYVMSTTGARYGSKIYSTVDTGAYRWTLGDGSTIPGLEEAVRGMRPGGGAAGHHTAEAGVSVDLGGDW